MIERLADMPPGTIGFRVGGKLTRADYTDVLVPELGAELEGGGPLRAVYVVDDLTGGDAGALLEDAKLGFDLLKRHRDQIKRSAIVTDMGWMAKSSRLFAWMIPGEARIFSVAELDDATAWVAGD